ncbi:hypothetical protein ONZ45_g1447 [Pleurotus djamor]|nr:hypothetical protein ONZ45_g1447 [Pleurotus djamor]
MYNSSNHPSRHQFHRSVSKQGDIIPTKRGNNSPITPAVTGLFFPSPIDTNVQDNGRQNPIFKDIQDEFSLDDERSQSYDTAEPVTPTDYQALDDLWGTLRLQKEIKMAKEPPKVKSFEGVDLGAPSEIQPPSSRQLSERQSSSKHTSHTKQKVTFRESSDGRNVMAYFNLPGLTKQDVHVSYQRNRLVVTWDEVEEQEIEEQGVIVRERRERTCNRAIPLPEGTKFEEIRAAMDGPQLVLRYPNINSRAGVPNGRSKQRSRGSS